MESPVSAPVSGHVKRVVVHEGKQSIKDNHLTAAEYQCFFAGDSINQGDLIAEITH